MAKTTSGIAGINAPNKGKRYLFAIAIDEYDFDKNGYQPLSNPVLDCTELCEVFINKYGFEHILPPMYNGDATRGGILDKLDEIALDPGDTLVLTFSGHGDVMNDEGQWAACDSKSSSRSSHVSASDIMDRLDKLVNAQHIFLIVDCCFPGGIFKSKYLSQGIPDDDAGDSDKSRQVLASGRNKPVPDGAPGEHSPFAKELIAILDKNSRPLNVNQLLIELRRKFNGTPQNPSLDSLKLAAHEGGDFELVPKNFSLDLPDAEELARAFYEIKYPNGWWDELEVLPKQFNAFTLQGKPFSGHLLAAKRFVRLFLSQSGHFECYSFSFGSNTLAVKGLWEEFGRQYNMASAAKADIVKVIYEKTLDKICVFFVEIPSGSQFPGIENIVEDFWEEFQNNVKTVSAQLAIGLPDGTKPNPFFLFLMDKRGLADAAYHLKVKEPFANTVSPNPIPDFTISVLNFWYARYQQNELVFRGRFKELDFTTFDAARDDFSPENTILKICEHCEFEKDSSPYQRIFYKHDEI